MVFTTTTLFKGIPCQYGEQCSMTNCIFSHDLRPQNTDPVDTQSGQISNSSTHSPREPPAKRRKVTYDNAADKPPSKADQIRAGIAAARTSPGGDQLTSAGSTNAGDASAVNSPPSLTKRVSPPPPLNGKATSHSSEQAGANKSRSDSNLDNSNGSKPHATSVAPEPEFVEKLNPRLIANDPAGHNKRSLFLKHLHSEMARLNKGVLESQTLEYKHLLHLSEQELVKFALDEEEKVAKDQPQIYSNVIKQKIALHKKMTVEDWTKQIARTLGKGKSNQDANKGAKPIETGLSPEEEVLILPHLVADQSGLAPFGYIPTPPTEAQAKDAAVAVEASKNYEICDRCSARFQVFPERNEEGMLTSNSPCVHHANRKYFPPKTKADYVSGTTKEPYFPCCNGPMGSQGCTKNEFHVFKASIPARLAAVLPFITTPENESPAKDKHGKKVHAVAFDCEMGYTTSGMELIRLTAVSWPTGEELLDILVRPVGAIIDLNSRFSGVWPETFTNAVPYEKWLPTSPTLPIVSSPAQARTLLCTFLTPQTPLLGHAIDNDLNAVRLCHPTIVDTVLLYPHNKGLPMRFGLKMLAQRHLGRSIQTGGASGHDSHEDALAAGDLVRRKVGEKWRLLRAMGWRMEGGKLIGGTNGSATDEGDMKDAVAREVAGAVGTKRRKKRPETADESTEDEEVPVGGGVAGYVQRGRVNPEGEKGA